jgi:hypothetical protein
VSTRTRAPSGPLRAVVVAVAALASVGAASCASGSRRADRPAQARARTPQLEDALDGPPDLLIVVRPRSIARDRLYGPLFRRASVLASTRSGAANVGTTALAAFERADEAIFAGYDRGGRDAVIAVRGVPADVDAITLVDTAGKPLWERVRESPGGVTELVARDPKVDAALFVLPMRTWVIAVGDAVPRAREVYGRASPASSRPAPLTLDPVPLAVVQLRGEALLRHEARLRVGPLAPIGRDLDHVDLALEPGVRGEVAGRFVYTDERSAFESEQRMKDVLGAFSRKFGEKLRWLDAIRVVHASREVSVRGRLPQSWVEGLLDAEAADTSSLDQAPPPVTPASGDAGAPAPP